MTPKTISTRHQAVACDVCGRTLLQGEHAEPFLADGSRRTVCELCTSRAAHEGWIRESAGDALGVRRSGRDQRGSLLRRLRRRDEAAAASRGRRGVTPDPEGAPRADRGQGTTSAADAPTASNEPAPSPAPARATASRLQAEIERVNRTVHAVPTNSQLKLEKALAVFNDSDAPHRVSGIARSLGAPIVAVVPSMTEGSIVAVVVAWELCWYRYELDLADAAAGVRLIGQGTELEELSAVDKTANAATNDRGELVLAS